MSLSQEWKTKCRVLNWKKEGDQLILAGNSIGNGQTIEFIDTMKIKKITADSLVLDNRGMEIRYAKQK